MAVENLKATALTNLDSTPPVYPATGVGASGHLKNAGGYQTASASASVTSTYAFCRIPTNAKVKRVTFESEAQGAGKFDVGVYYSSSTTDGTSSANRGTAVDADFFASAIDCASAVVPTNVINESGTNTLAKRNQPLWQALGLTSDPGGMFDIVATCVTTAVTTGTGKLGVEVDYVI